MKVSVSLPEEDVEFLDVYASEYGVASRSAVLHRAIRMLRSSGLESAYEGAFDEWAGSDAQTWEGTIGDGLA